MNTFEAIYKRKSVRNYKMEEIPEELLQEIREYYKEIPQIFPGIQTELVIESCIRKNHIKIGNKIPYRMKLYSEKKERDLMNAGYMLEMMSLYLTTKGMGTCLRRDSIKKTTDFQDKELTMEMAMGYPAGTNIRKEEQFRRLELKQLCVEKDSMQPWMKNILESARLAPSRMNRQPWRFLVSGGKIHIFSKKDDNGFHGKYTEFDLGVMLAHIMTAAEEMWLNADLIRLENIVQKKFKNYNYVLSVIVTQ